MKKIGLVIIGSLLFAWIVLFIATANAECNKEIVSETVTGQYKIDTTVPKALVGAMITVQTKDGYVRMFSADQFKVVPRKQQFITQKVTQTNLVVCQNTSSPKLKNRVSLMGGEGPNPGFDSTQTANQVSVQNKIGAVAGVQYQRDTGLKVKGLPVNVGIQGQTNKSVLLNLGVDF